LALSVKSLRKIVQRCSWSTLIGHVDRLLLRCTKKPVNCFVAEWNCELACALPPEEYFGNCLAVLFGRKHARK